MYSGSFGTGVKACDLWSKNVRFTSEWMQGHTPTHTTQNSNPASVNCAPQWQPGLELSFGLNTTLNSITSSSLSTIPSSIGKTQWEPEKMKVEDSQSREDSCCGASQKSPRHDGENSASNSSTQSSLMPNMFNQPSLHKPSGTLPARADALYEKGPGTDGQYRCPWESCGLHPYPVWERDKYRAFIDYHLEAWGCKICKLDFAGQYERDIHLDQCHNRFRIAESIYLCTYTNCTHEIAGNGFSDFRNLKNHMWDVHRDKPHGDAEFLRRRLLGLMAEREQQVEELQNVRHALDVELKRSRELQMMLQEVMDEQNQEIMALFASLGTSLKESLKDSWGRINKKKNARKIEFRNRLDQRNKEMLGQESSKGMLQTVMPLSTEGN